MASSRQLRGDETQLFEVYAERLERFVANQVGASQTVIEDACANAWIILLRRQPDRATAWPWLKVVAVREAWRLSALERREPPVAAVPEDLPSTSDLQATAEFHEELARLAREMDARKRTMLLLFAIGFSYADIAALTGDSVRTVERQLVRARRHIRQMR